MFAGLVRPVQRSCFIVVKRSLVRGECLPRHTSLVSDRSSLTACPFKALTRSFLTRISQLWNYGDPGASQEWLRVWHWAWGVVLSPSWALARCEDGLAGGAAPSLELDL